MPIVKPPVSDTYDRSYPSTSVGNSEGKSQSVTENAQTIVVNAMNNLSYILDKMSEGEVSKEETMNTLMSVTMEALAIMEQNRMNAIKEMMRNVYDEEADEAELIEDEEERMKKVPALVQMGIPITKNVLQVVAKELAVLDNAFRNKNILNYKNWRRNDKHLMVVPKCTTYESFVTTNNSTKFIDSLPSMIHGCKNNKDKDAEVSGWIIKRLGKKHEETLLNVCREMGYNIGQLQMELHTAVAMWDEANINTESQRVVLRYLRGCFGKVIKIPGGYHIKDDKDFEDGNYCAISPVYGVTNIEDEHITFWTKPITSVLSATLTKRFYNRKEDKEITEDKQLNKVDLVVGGDHGQRRFRMLMKVICRNNLSKTLA